MLRPEGATAAHPELVEGCSSGARRRAWRRSEAQSPLKADCPDTTSLRTLRPLGDPLALRRAQGAMTKCQSGS